jgi:hypothetical protein
MARIIADTRFYRDTGVIEQKYKVVADVADVYRQELENSLTWVYRTHEQQFIRALIAMGWIPPQDVLEILEQSVDEPPFIAEMESCIR